MQKLTYLVVGVMLVSLAGCVTVEKVVRERVDQDTSGNRGYIQGPPAAAQEKAGPEKREYIDVKVEIPTFTEVKEHLPKAKAKQKEVSQDKAAAESTSGNEGYLEKGTDLEKELPSAYREEPMSEEPISAEESKAETYIPETTPRTYKVKAGDSLSQIAKDVYGKASKWTLIYEANSEKIKDPNKVKEGTLLNIPALKDIKDAESKYVK